MSRTAPPETKGPLVLSGERARQVKGDECASLAEQTFIFRAMFRTHAVRITFGRRIVLPHPVR